MRPEPFRAEFIEACRPGEVRASFRSGEGLHTIYFRSDDTSLMESQEVLVASGVIPAMCTGRELRLESALDPRFSSGVQNIQSILAGWYDSFQRVEVVAGGRVMVPSREGKRVGLFFSGGVDSFYTLLKHQDEITDLIFVHGFDIRLESRDICEQAEESIRRIGEQFGKRVIKVETNIRSMLDSYAHWERTHGAALAAVGHLLGDEFDQIYIAASDTEGFLSPWGSHPELDPLWSRSDLEFVHDGCAATRPKKLRQIALSGTALQNLRVCWKNRKGALNCGRCEKCIRTMIGLKVMGVLEGCNVFGHPLRVWRVLGIKIPHPDIATGQFYNLVELKKEPKYRILYWALQFAFLRSRIREFRKSLSGRIKRLK